MPHHKALKRFAIPLLLVLAAAWVGPTPVLADQPNPSFNSVLTIEEAIDVAKRCIVARNIRVVGSFIEAARYEPGSRGGRGPSFRVTWAPSREIKGGQVFVTVFSGRTCEVTFGE